MTKKQTLSENQDKAANPENNVWVQANAGTGKTSVLVKRLLRILFRTPDCGKSGILCLTYTNAGAGEMRNRILKALRGWALASDEELVELLSDVALNRPANADDIVRAREIFFHYIDNPDILKIKTIHGFCEEILHRFPIEAGISPAWQLATDATQKVLLQDTFVALINSPSASDAVYRAFDRIVERVSESRNDDLLKILSGQYGQFFQVDDVVKYREYFVETIKKYLELDRLPNFDFSVEELEKIIFLAQEEQNSRKTPAKYLDKIINNTKQYIDTTIDFEEYKKAYLTGSGANAGSPIKDVAKKDYLIAEQERVYAVNQYNLNLGIFEDTMAVFDLAAAFAEEYRQQKRARNLLDFEDLLLYTRRLFSDAKNMGWVLSQLDLSLSHILVDEAQDTSPMQWDILQMLSGDFFTDGDTGQLPHSLFVVGDTKQSIYGFQGADPRAFAQSRAAIAAQIKNNMRAIQEIPLAQSFRSTAPILECVDRFFADGDVIELSDFVNNVHKCYRVDDAGAVEIHRLVSKAESDTTVKEYISDVADKIQALIRSGKYVAKDIMVLVQNRQPMAAPLVAELKRRGIEVAGSDRIVLPNFPAVRDMLNMVRWCLNPVDDYSLCCVLKSPIFYLTEADIFKICEIKNQENAARKKADKYATPMTVFEVLERQYPDIYAQLELMKQYAQSLAPYSFFCKLMDAAREKFIAALGEQVIEPLEEFMTICLSYERTQSGTLHHFLKWFITGNSEIKRDMDASMGVRVVTVHGSKGLEAPVVFLVDTVRTPDADDVIPISGDGDLPVWLWAPRTNDSKLYGAAKSANKRTQMAEYYRLLYVAMTRARDELYIYGFVGGNSTKAPDNSWHAQLWRVFAKGNEEQQYIRITNDKTA